MRFLRQTPRLLDYFFASVLIDLPPDICFLPRIRLAIHAAFSLFFSLFVFQAPFFHSPLCFFSAYTATIRFIFYILASLARLPPFCHDAAAPKVMPSRLR